MKLPLVCFFEPDPITIKTPRYLTGFVHFQYILRVRADLNFIPDMLDQAVTTYPERDPLSRSNYAPDSE